MYKNRNKIKKFIEFNQTDKIKSLNISDSLKSTLIFISKNPECVVSDFKFLSKKYLKQNNLYNYSLLKSVSEFMIKSGYLMNDYDQFPYTKNTDLNKVKISSKVLRICLREILNKYELKIKDVIKITPEELQKIKDIKPTDITELRKIVRKSGQKW